MGREGWSGQKHNCEQVKFYLYPMFTSNIQGDMLNVMLGERKDGVKRGGGGSDFL